MKYCGIELKSNEARIASIEFVDGDYNFIATEIKKIPLEDSKSQDAALAFRKAFDEFLGNHNFDKIAIKERMRKGKFAGGADSFKMEGILQALPYPIQLMHTNKIKAAIKDKEIKTGEINKYQEEALKAALSLV